MGPRSRSIVSTTRTAAISKTVLAVMSSTSLTSPRTLVWGAFLMLCLVVISSESAPVNDLLEDAVVPEETSAGVFSELLANPSYNAELRNSLQMDEQHSLLQAFKLSRAADDAKNRATQDKEMNAEAARLDSMNHNLANADKRAIAYNTKAMSEEHQEADTNHLSTKGYDHDWRVTTPDAKTKKEELLETGKGKVKKAEKTATKDLHAASKDTNKLSSDIKKATKIDNSAKKELGKGTSKKKAKKTKQKKKKAKKAAKKKAAKKAAKTAKKAKKKAKKTKKAAKKKAAKKKAKAATAKGTKKLSSDIKKATTTEDKAQQELGKEKKVAKKAAKTK